MVILTIDKMGRIWNEDLRLVVIPVCTSAGILFKYWREH
jgi:hypothetical protein